MKKYFILITFLTISVAFLMTACSSSDNDNGNDDNIIWSYYGFLAYSHRPAEDLSVIGVKKDTETDPKIFLNLNVTSAPCDSNPASRYTTEGDKDIEQQIKNFLDPTGTKYRGTIPYTLEYRTEVCKNITICLYDKDSTLLADITDVARFIIPDKENEPDPEVVKLFNGALLINSKRELLGWIEDGTTVKEYLSHEPMVFGRTHMSFPDLDPSLKEEGRIINIEIELETKTLTYNGLLYDNNL